MGERAWEGARGCERESGREEGRELVCVCVCERERERGREGGSARI